MPGQNLHLHAMRAKTATRELPTQLLLRNNLLSSLLPPSAGFPIEHIGFTFSSSSFKINTRREIANNRYSLGSTLSISP